MVGVLGTASIIDMEFTIPAGVRTGSLFATGRPLDVLNLPGKALTEVSLIDATIPSVIHLYHGVRSTRLKAVFPV